MQRHGVAWRTTRLPCGTCGSATSSMRRDQGAGLVEIRCERCDTGRPSAAWSLDNPSLRPHLTVVARPSAVVGRMADWGHDWWPRAIDAGRTSCTRCGTEVAVAPYERPELDDLRSRRGWHASCTACGEELTTSLLGLTLVHPETRALRARRPRAHAVPTREVRRAGRPVLVVAVRDDVSGDGVAMLFDDATTRPLGLVASV